MAVERLTLGALAILLLASTPSGLPLTADNAAADNKTLSTELKQPAEEDQHHFMVFIVNLYGVKNISGETSAEMFENELTEKVPDILEPLATVLLVVETDDDSEESAGAADLDEIAKDLEKEGFKVERLGSGSQTKLIRVRLDEQNVDGLMNMTSNSKTEESGKIRRKRTSCLKCKGFSKGGGGGGGGGGYYGGHGYGGGYPVVVYPGGGGGGCPPGGCGYNYYPSGGGGGCGYGGCGGGRTQPAQVYAIPVLVVQQQQPSRPKGGGGYHPHPSGGGGGGCNTCGGGGGSASANVHVSATAYSSGK
ncbi:hypothetical protein KM043_007480 [Ampulex compressa]|nr:hypothetical protein KM043_007480 [Ampulex compressa]